jgi:hypothetical protein
VHHDLVPSPLLLLPSPFPCLVLLLLLPSPFPFPFLLAVDSSGFHRDRKETHLGRVQKAKMAKESGEGRGKVWQVWRERESLEGQEME